MTSTVSVLIVDDEPEILELLNDVLSDRYDVRKATKAQDALTLLRERPADIIISDQKMPVMTGVEFLRKSMRIAPEAVRVLMTAYTEFDAVVRGINEAKISYYLTKPIDLEQIRLLVDQSADNVQLRGRERWLMEALEDYNRSLERRVEERTRELLVANEELLRLQELREQMIRMAVHNLKNPISNIQLAFGELSRWFSEEDDAELAHGIRDSLGIMQSLVGDMLSAATLANSNQRLDVRPLEISVLLSASVAAFTHPAEKKNIILEAEFPHDLPLVLGHAHKLREVLDNLISNAVKYTPPGGNVFVSGAVKRSGNAIEIRVRDTGQGMTESDKMAAFGEFKQLSARPTGGETSSGLGLFIVKKIIELHQGTIAIESEGKNKGTTFIITVPIAEV